MHNQKMGSVIVALLFLSTFSLFSSAELLPEPEVPTVDYEATPELLSARYPYVLMSYLSEMDAIVECKDPEKFECGDPKKQLFIFFRLSYLGSKGIQLVENPEAIPEKWRSFFVATREKAISSGEKTYAMTYQLSIPDTNIRIRVFKMGEDPLSSAFTGKKVILAIAGETTNDALQCLVTQPKLIQPAHSACSRMEKQLEDIKELAESFQEMYPNHTLEIVGYSYSGAVAQVALSMSRAFDQAFIFNSYGIDPTWLEAVPEERLARIHHSYVEGSLLHGQDRNVLSRYSRWRLPQHKVVVPGMKISSRGLEPEFRQLYKMKHRDGWLDSFYNFATSVWVLHSKEAVLRAFEVHLGFNYPWS